MATRLLIDPQKPDERNVAEAIRILRGGGVVAFPTETFYGLGVDARQDRAIEKIFRIKGRNFRNPISVIIDDDRGVDPLVTVIPETAQILIKKFWPGPLTLLFDASASVSPYLTGGTGKIGIRVTSHPIASLLAKELVSPITATSANLSGHPESSTAEDALTRLGDHLDAVIDGGASPGGLGSTILDITVDPPLILRPGVVSRMDILNALGISEM